MIGSIKFYGIVDDSEKLATEELGKTEILYEAHIIKDYIQVDEIYYWYKK